MNPKIIIPPGIVSYLYGGIEFRFDQQDDRTYEEWITKKLTIDIGSTLHRIMVKDPDTKKDIEWKIGERVDHHYQYEDQREIIRDFVYVKKFGWFIVTNLSMEGDVAANFYKVPTAKRYKHGRIDRGWEGAGKPLTILGKAIVVNGMSWTPVLHEDEEDPTFFKTSGIKMLK